MDATNERLRSQDAGLLGFTLDQVEPLTWSSPAQLHARIVRRRSVVW
jgi:hypothetical protein